MFGIVLNQLTLNKWKEHLFDVIYFSVISIL